MLQFDELYQAALRVLTAENEGKRANPSDIRKIEELDGPIPAKESLAIHAAEIVSRVLGAHRY